jgi:tetratricopeptide (TPR) repeat protein
MDEHSTPQILKDLLVVEDESAAEADAKIKTLLSGKKIGRKSGFWTWGLCERLLERSWELRQKNPTKMVVLAQTAVEVAQKVDRRKYGAQNVADLQARAWAGLANAYRISDELSDAEAAFRQAFEARRKGTFSPLLHARLAELSASLLCDQRYFPQAFKLLDFAYRIYKENGDRHNAGRALIKKGWHAGLSGDPEDGIRLIARGLRLIERARDPKLGLQSLHTVLLFRVERGEFKTARRQIWEMRPLYDFHGEHILKVKLRGIEGKVFAGLGEFDRAARAFQQAKESFLERGMDYDAALISFDLAALWLREGKRVAVRQLLQETLEIFRARYIAREGIAALVMLRDVADRNELTFELLDRITMLFEVLKGEPSWSEGTDI